MACHFRILALTCLLAAAACSEAPQAPRQTAEPGVPAASQNAAAHSSAELAGLRLIIEGEGLALNSEDRSSGRVAFGSPAEAAVAAARTVYGAALEEQTLTECGAGPLQVTRFSGITIAAQDGKFAGWSLDQQSRPPLAVSAQGIAIGFPRAALEKADKVQIFESSLGQEFTAGGIAGLLGSGGADAKVTHLWAGATCIMR